MHDVERRGSEPGEFGPVAGIVLAAGEGRGFGGPKALVSFAGEMLVERAIRTLTAGGCRPVVVVLGAGETEVRARCDLGGAVIAVNEAWSEGMGGSLRVGLEAARGCGAAAGLVALVDQPLVSPALVARLIGSWESGAPAAVAAWSGEGLTPVVLDRSLWESVAQRAVGDVGARALLRERPELVTLVDCADVGAPDDIDTVADLKRLEAGQPTWPTARP
jgi:nicotine blue oxidoreductase